MTNLYSKALSPFVAQSVDVSVFTIHREVTRNWNDLWTIGALDSDSTEINHGS